ncbi:hypothetical protein PybrP1_002092 [[Pythium] brassicae (nom. inval.)]|nr:hypothetical protein PybrP1_002092 [[Pythium] brassicae (nom. inval.)]
MSSGELRIDSSSRSAFVFTNDSYLYDVGAVPVLGDILTSKREWDLPSRRTSSASELNRAFTRRHAKIGGALRDSEPPARLVSIAYAGLALHSAVAGFCNAFLRFGYRPLLVAYLTLHHRDQFASARYLLEWPAVLAVFVGIVSDMTPLFGYRRKSYMALGWLVVLLASVGIVVTTLLSPTKFTLFADPTKRGDAVATYTLESNPIEFATLFVTFGVLISVGLEVAWVVSLAMTVELAQCEPLLTRGRLQAEYFLIYYAAAAFAQLVVSRVIFLSDDADEPLRSAITMGEAGVMLCAGSALAFPTVIFTLKDKRAGAGATEYASDTDGDSDDAPAAPTFWARVRDLLRFCQEEVVYRVVLFVCGLVLTLGFYNQNVRDAEAQWSGVTASRQNDIQIGQSACVVLGIALWRAFLVNVSWQKLVLFGVSFHVGCSALVTVPTAFAWIRDEWYFLVLVSLQGVPKGWFKLFAVVPATEITDVGREGATVGLVLSFQWLVYIAAGTFSAMISHVIGTDVTAAQVDADATATRHSTVVAAAVYNLINLLALALAPLVPVQKLEAQQMLAASRRNSRMGFVIGAAFVLLLIFDLVANIVVMQS